MKTLLHNLAIRMINLFGVTLVWLVQWFCLGLFAITFLDGLVLHLPHDDNYITRQPFLALIILFIGIFTVLMIIDLPCKLVREQGVFTQIYHCWRQKKRPPQ